MAPHPKPEAVASDKELRYTGGDLSLLESGDLHDALIVSKEVTWKVHKTILYPRSTWFRDAFSNPVEGGQLPVVNLYNYEVRDIDTMLHFIYSGSLDDTQYNPKGHHATFEKYARLFTIASDFQLPHLTTDAKTLLGQFCDRHLLTLCTYDPTTSGRTGVLAPSPAHPPFLSDLLSAIHLAFPPTPTTPATPLQLLLASFCYGGRTRLFTYPAFRALADTHPSLGNTIFRLMLPGTACEWAPAPVCDTAAGVDHTHRSQHPDRCAHCDRTFGDSALRKKAMFNPFEANVRAATYCAGCVKGNEKGEKPLWRMEGGATTQ